MKTFSTPIKKIGEPIRSGMAKLHFVSPAHPKAPLDLVTLTDPNSMLSEQYRLLFLKLHQVCQEQKKRTIAITSSLKGEGKTTTASNLAIVATRDFGKKCLLVDVDFKNPTIGKYFHLTQEKVEFGLMDVLMKRCSFESALTKGPVENLTLLPMGRSSGKTSDTLVLEGLSDVVGRVRSQYYNVLWDDASGDFHGEAEQESDLFDYIFVDAPPVVPTFDMNLISQAVEGILFVVRSGEAPKHIITRAIKGLDRSKMIGAVLNCAHVPWLARAYEYGYYAYVANK